MKCEKLGINMCKHYYRPCANMHEPKGLLLTSQQRKRAKRGINNSPEKENASLINIG